MYTWFSRVLRETHMLSVMWYPCKHALFYLVDHSNLILYIMVGKIIILLFIKIKILLCFLCLLTKICYMILLEPVMQDKSKTRVKI